MSTIGYLQVHAYTSIAELPLKDVAIVITSPDNTAIAMRLTDRSGLIGAIEIPVPDFEKSQEPDPNEKPYTTINLFANLKGYEPVIAENIQVFAGTTTFQDLEMVPLSDSPYGDDDITKYDTPPQNL